MYHQQQQYQLPNQIQGILNMAANPQQEKINRELFVGNTPQGTSELLLQHFLNAAMRRSKLCGPHDQPILNCRVSQKFAFIELQTFDMADRALSLNGIPFLGSFLKVSRPSKYVPPPGSPPAPMAVTWQQLTGATLPAGAAVDPEQEKLSRELFIGNTTPEMTEEMIRTFLGDAMQQVGLTTQPGNPINACRVSGKFAFVELRSKEEAQMALNLNNIPFMGTALRVGRPSKYTGPVDQHGNWEDILAKYMAGEIAPPGGAGAAAQQQQQPQRPNLPPSRVVELLNMVSENDIANEEERMDILEDTKEECEQFGKLVQVIIPKKGESGATKIFLEYSTQEDATKALEALEGRTFDGKQVEANYFDETKFLNKEYD